MRTIEALLAAAATAMVTGGSLTEAAGDQVVILGDSLSKEYDIEFAADGYDFSRVKNWIQVLDDRRNGAFDYGSLQGYFFDYRAPAGHEYNWSVPTAMVDVFVDIVEEKTLLDEQAHDDITDQLENDAERAVIFLGGNDIDSVYGDLYEGRPQDAQGVIDGIFEGLRTVLDWVIGIEPELEVVLVSVPHVGATPEVKSDHPTDPVKTARVTAAIADLNGRLRDLAASRGAGFADIFSVTVDLLDDGPLVIGGIPFINEADEDGDIDYVWLGGDLAMDFHPNTSGQALIANRIVEAFNEAFGAEIAPLSQQEILESLLGKDADIPFAQWAEAYFGAAVGPAEDSDGDGFPAFVEFGLGLDPSRPDANEAVRFDAPVRDGVRHLEMSYRLRHPDGPSQHVEVVPQTTDDLVIWTDVSADAVSENADGSFTVSVPASGDVRLLRLQARAPQ